jgi:hypothetical protein
MLNLNTTSEADEQLGAATPEVKASGTLPISTDSAPAHPPKQSSDSRSTDALKAHTSGLSEPDIDSLLELIQGNDGFEEESKPERDKVVEAIMAARGASQSKEWSNVLRGIIILITCLGFPKGDVSESNLTVSLTLTNDDRKREANSQRVTDRANASFGCGTVDATTTSHRTFRIGLRSLALKCASG